MTDEVINGGGASLTTDPAAGTSTATDVSLKEYLAAVRAGDRALDAERDRRYAEVQKVREDAEREAVRLAREIQAYKDEKANELRAQIESERGIYATKEDLIAAIEKVEAQMKPVLDYMLSQQGRSAGSEFTFGRLVAMVGLSGGILGIVVVLANVLTS